MPGPGGPWGDALVEAVRAGEVHESVIDDHVARLLGLADRVGALGRGRDYPENLPGPESSVRKDQLTRLAAGGIAVLTNREQTLPLDRTRSLALIGRHAVETIDMGGGSAQVKLPYQVSVAEGLSCLLGDKVSVTDGVEVRTRPTPARGGLLANPRTGEPGVAFSLLATDGSVIEERHGPAASTVVGFDDDFDQTVHSMRFSARINADGPIVIGVMGAGAWTLEVAGHALSYTRPCPEPGSLSGLGYSTSRYAQPLLTSNDGSPVVSVAITNTGTAPVGRSSRSTSCRPRPTSRSDWWAGSRSPWHPTRRSTSRCIPTTGCGAGGTPRAASGAGYPMAVS